MIWAIGIFSAIVAEVIGKQLNIMRPSTAMQAFSPFIHVLLKKLGYTIAYLSDIAYVFRELFDFLHRYLLPIYNALHDAMCDIWGSIWDVLNESAKGFFFGYADGLQGAYNQLMSMMTSILVFAGGFLVLGFLLEGIGLKRNIKTIRPSYYIIKCVANPIYDLTHTVSYCYTKVGCVLSNIRDFLERILQWIMPWIRPYITMINEGRIYVGRAINDLTEAPIQGITNGFNAALTQHPYLTAYIAATLAVGTMFYFFDVNPLTLLLKLHF